MKSIQFSLALLLAMLPAVIGFIPLNAPQHLLKTSVVTKLYESTPTREESVSAGNSSTSDADYIAKQTNDMLEAMGDEEENKEEEEEEEEYPIFNPNSFWTERSGRFPRKMNE